MIKAVIFDMDGLLIETKPFWEEVMFSVFHQLGLPYKKESVQEVWGLRVPDIIDYWYTKHPWQGPSKDEVKKQILDGVYDLIRKRGKLLPGVKRVLSLLHDAKIPMAIASTSSIENIQVVIEKLGIDDIIKIIYSSEEEKYNKPHPGVFLTTADLLHVRPEDCLVFEDSPIGVLAAKAAQMKCIAVPHPENKNHKYFCIADAVLNTLDDFKIDYVS